MGMFWALMLFSSLRGLPQTAGRQGPEILTNALQVLEVPLNQGGPPKPAHIQGIVTYADTAWSMWFIKDETGGVSLTRGSNSVPLRPGMEVIIDGEAVGAAFAPSLLETNLTILGERPLPSADLLSFDQLTGGKEDSQWIELDCVVKSVASDKSHLIFSFSSPRALQAIVPGQGSNVPADALALVDARVRVRGVCGTRFNARGNLVDYALFVPNLAQIRILEPATSAPFDLPLTKIANPLRYANAHRFGHRIRISGILTARVSATEFFMQDDSGGAFCQTVETNAFVPGDRIEAAVFPEPAEASPSMMAGVARKLSDGPLPASRKIDAAEPVQTDWDSVLITAEGELLDVLRHKGDAFLLLQAGERRFNVRLAGQDAEKAIKRINPGSKLSVTGVGTVVLDDQKEPRHLTLFVRDPENVKVMIQGPWWTPQHGLALLGLATLLLVAWRVHGLWQESRLKEKYQQIFDHATDLISTHDLDGRFTSSNSAWESSTGFTPDMLVGKPLHEILSPGQEKEWSGWWKKVISDRTNSPKDLKITGAHGRQIWIEIKSLMVKDPRGRAQVHSISRDVTRRRQSELRRAEQQKTLELIATGAPLAEVLGQLIRLIEEQSAEAKGAILLLDPGSNSLRLGLAPNLPKDFSNGIENVPVKEGNGACATAAARRCDVVVEDIATDSICVPRQALASRHGIKACWSTPILSRSNQVLGTFALFYKSRHQPTEDDRALMQAACSLASIALERRNQEELRSQLEARLRQSEKMQAIGTLAGGIAHDFNNILASILGNAELLKMDIPRDSQLNDSLTGILKGIERARTLVLQILTFGRSEQPERHLMPLAPVVTEALNLIRASLPSTIEIRTALESTPLQVRANATQIHQVLMNLCHNASHAMGGGPGCIEIHLTVVTIDGRAVQTSTPLCPGTYIKISVSDTGHGMDAGTLDRIFEPFFTTKGPGQGTGLGLAVVHGIMESHEGAITVISSPGKGSTFHLYFPALLSGATSSKLIESSLPLGQGQSILVVDDEEPLVNLATKLLSRLNYQVTAMTDSTEALKRFRNEPGRFDLLITDLTMPKLTGTDLAKSMLSIRPDFPIILCTGHRDGKQEEPFEPLGIRHVLSKPFRIEVLAQAIFSALSKKQP